MGAPFCVGVRLKSELQAWRGFLAVLCQSYEPDLQHYYLLHYLLK